MPAREDQGLFWQENRRRVSEAEAERYASAAETGQRLVETVRGWLAKAAGELTPEQRAWLHVEEIPTVPDPLASHLDHPHIALNEIARMVWAGPTTRPDWWELTEAQEHAVEVILAVRAAVETVRGIPAEQAVIVLERAVDLGVTVAQAHVYPWEPIAARGERYSKEQSIKAKKALAKRWKSRGRDVLAEVLTTLARKTDTLGDPLPSEELWPQLYSSLEERQLEPEEIEDEDPRKRAIKFNNDQVTFGTFENRLSQIRSKKFSR